MISNEDEYSSYCAVDVAIFIARVIICEEGKNSVMPDRLVNLDTERHSDALLSLSLSLSLALFLSHTH